MKMSFGTRLDFGTAFGELCHLLSIFELRAGGEVGLAVIYLIRGVSCFDFKGVELAVGGGWGKGQAVFVAD